MDEFSDLGELSDTPTQPPQRRKAAAGKKVVASPAPPQSMSQYEQQQRDRNRPPRPQSAQQQQQQHQRRRGKAVGDDAPHELGTDDDERTSRRHGRRGKKRHQQRGGVDDAKSSSNTATPSSPNSEAPASPSAPSPNTSSKQPIRVASVFAVSRASLVSAPSFSGSSSQRASELGESATLNFTTTTMSVIGGNAVGAGSLNMSFEGGTRLPTFGSTAVARKLNGSGASATHGVASTPSQHHIATDLAKSASTLLRSSDVESILSDDSDVRRGTAVPGSEPRGIRSRKRQVDRHNSPREANLANAPRSRSPLLPSSPALPLPGAATSPSGGAAGGHQQNTIPTEQSDGETNEEASGDEHQGEDEDAAIRKRAMNLQLTDQEVRQLQVLFDSIDENGNGLLSIDELMRAMKNLGFSLSRLQVVALVREVAFELYSEAKFKAAERAHQHHAHSVNHVGGNTSVIRGPGTSHTHRPSTSVVGGGTSILQRSAKRRSVLEWAGAELVDDDEEIEVDFDDFVKIIALWQGAAQFQIFEHRSNEAIDHINRAQQTRFLLPDSHAMWVWNAITLFVIGYTWVAVLMAHAFTFHDQLWLMAVTTAPDFVAFLLSAVDVGIRASTAVLRKVDGHTWLVDDRWGILKHYAAQWLIVDLLAALPLRFFFFFGGSMSEAHYSALAYNSTGNATNASVNATANITSLHGLSPSGYGATFSADVETTKLIMQIAIWLNHLRLFKTLKITSLFASSLRIHVNKWYITLHYVLAPAMTDALKFVCLVHLLAIILIPIQDDAVVRMKGSQADFDDDAERLRLDRDTTYVSYARAVYTVMQFLSTAGFGDLPPTTDSVRIFYMFLIFLGMSINGLVVGTLVSFFQRSDIDSSRKTVIVELKAVLDYFEVPDGLKSEILRFQNHLQLNDLMRTHESTVCNLPPEMQHNLELFVRVRAISAVPFFADVHNSAKILLCQNLMSVIFCPEEFIVAFGEVGEEMFFINYGFVDILTSTSAYIATLSQGQYFGEMALLHEEPIERTASVKSITYCDLFVLRKRAFRSVLNRFPRFRAQIEKVALERRAQAKAALPASPTATGPQPPPATVRGMNPHLQSALRHSSMLSSNGLGARKGSFKSVSIVDAKLLRRDPVQRALMEAVQAVQEQQEAEGGFYSPDFNDSSFRASRRGLPVFAPRVVPGGTAPPAAGAATNNTADIGSVSNGSLAASAGVIGIPANVFASTEARSIASGESGGAQQDLSSGSDAEVGKDATARPNSSLSSFGSSRSQTSVHGGDGSGFFNPSPRSAHVVLQSPTTRGGSGHPPPQPFHQHTAANPPEIGSLTSGSVGSGSLGMAAQPPMAVSSTALNVLAMQTASAPRHHYEELPSDDSWNEDLPRLSVTCDETTMEIFGPKARKHSSNRVGDEHAGSVTLGSRQNSIDSTTGPSGSERRGAAFAVQGTDVSGVAEAEAAATVASSGAFDEASEKKFSIASSQASQRGGVPPELGPSIGQLPHTTSIHIGVGSAHASFAQPQVGPESGANNPLQLPQSNSGSLNAGRPNGSLLIPTLQGVPFTGMQRAASLRQSNSFGAFAAQSVESAFAHPNVESENDSSGDAREVSATRFNPARPRGLMLPRKAVTLEELHNPAAKLRAELEDELQFMRRDQLVDFVQLLMAEALDTETLINELVSTRTLFGRPQQYNEDGSGVFGGAPFSTAGAGGGGGGTGAEPRSRRNSFRSVSFFNNLRRKSSTVIGQSFTSGGGGGVGGGLPSVALPHFNRLMSIASVGAVSSPRVPQPSHGLGGPQPH